MLRRHESISSFTYAFFMSRSWLPPGRCFLSSLPSAPAEKLNDVASLTWCESWLRPEHCTRFWYVVLVIEIFCAATWMASLGNKTKPFWNYNCGNDTQPATVLSVMTTRWAQDAHFARNPGRSLKQGSKLSCQQQWFFFGRQSISFTRAFSLWAFRLGVGVCVVSILW